MNEIKVLRLGPIAGNHGLYNEIISMVHQKVSYDEVVNNNAVFKTMTIYFGGDVQDYPEEMSSHRDHGKHLKWNLLNMVSLLSLKFPSSTICVIKPKRMELKTFSCYDNFVPCNDVGAPTHTEMNSALAHLKNLIDNTIQALSTQYASELDTCEANAVESGENTCDGNVNLPNDSLYENINLVGFSKGCAVLNQLAMEAHTITSAPDSENASLRKFWDKVRSIYWLDGGHSGGKNTWITQRRVLNTLASFPNLSLYIHVTPYQVQDERRPWIGKECKSFFDILRRAKATVNYTLHFEEEISSIDTHFKVLEAFR